MDFVPTTKLNRDYAMTRDTQVGFTTASSHVRVIRMVRSGIHSKNYGDSGIHLRFNKILRPY